MTKTNCYICKEPITDELDTFPFCSQGHWDFWKKAQEIKPIGKMSKFEQFLKNPKIMSKRMNT